METGQMRVFANNLEIEGALTRLAEYLELAAAPHVAILVGGGGALAIMGLVSRTTKDIDVIAFVGGDADRKLEKAQPLPDYLIEAKDKVAEDLGLPKDWINSGPTSLVDFGLPKGCLERSLRVEYGGRLTVYFIDRLDQIHLKIYAAVDSGGRHLTDLIALKPSPEELVKAAGWAMTHDTSPGFRRLLIDLLTQMGEPDAAAKI
jgi:hypothetical protein